MFNRNPSNENNKEMKIITAFDSFKGCMTASEACSAAEEGLLMAHKDAVCISLPMSDGGEGLVNCIAQVLPVDMIAVDVCGPMRDRVTAHYAISNDGKTAYMEMAEAAGLTLVPKTQRNPMIATTYGVGEMILDAAKRNCQKIVMGIGGSATCDGGRGMVECFSECDEEVKEKLANIEFLVASDVTNPLCGENGAARIFAPQKGATAEQVKLLDRQLLEFARKTADAGIAPISVMDSPGAGAAGGLGYALMAYVHATLSPGINLVLDLLDFDNQISDADFIITGEGKSDRQTLMGKVAAGVLARAQKLGKPCHLLSGQIEDRPALLNAGFSSVHSIHECDERPLEILMGKEISRENIVKSCSRLY